LIGFLSGACLQLVAGSAAVPVSAFCVLLFIFKFYSSFFGLRFFDCLQEQHQSAKTDRKVDQQRRVLPVLALNEVHSLLEISRLKIKSLFFIV
jgi:hypothetical protein